MAAWSTLARCTSQTLLKNQLVRPKFPVLCNAVVNNQVRLSHTFPIVASRWQWHLLKNWFHFYFMLGAIPLAIITFCANVFVGPATLTPIPEGYEPKYWEYYRNPISRWLARYIYHSPQQDYEKMLHVLYDEGQIIKLRKLEKKIWALQAERQDYRYNQFLPFYNAPTVEFREYAQRNTQELWEKDE